MTRLNMLLAVPCSAFATIAVLASGPSAPGSSLAAVPPCESNPPTPTDNPPAAPTNLRIIGGEQPFDEESWESEETASGPYAFEPSAVGATEASGFVPLVDGPHAYYENLASRGDCLVAYSLRSQAQIDQYRTKKDEPSQVRYLWPNDPDARRQDAAKIMIDGNNLRTQVWLPVGLVSGTRALITWDAWFGREFNYENTLIPNQKTFQFGSPGEDIWCEVRSRFAQADGPDIAEVDGRYYGDATLRGPNVTDNEPLAPQAGKFTIKSETWTRYWGLFEPGSGGWDLYTLWVADETTGPVKIFDRLQLKYRMDRMGIFRLEYNTSTTGGPENRGPLVGYARNFVVLKNPADVTNLLQKPVR